MKHTSSWSSPVLLLGLGLFAGSAGCHHGDESSALRIGLVSDVGALGGEPTVAAARLAVAALNDAGGLEIGGRRHRVELIIEDSKNNPEDAARAALGLINQQDVIAIVGPNLSQSAIPVAEIAERARLPMISPGSTHPQTTAEKRHVFRVAFTDPIQGRAMARFAIEDLGVTTAAVLYDLATDYSRDMASVFRRVFEAAGGQIVAFESYVAGAVDFRRQLVRIRDAKPGGLFLPNFNADITAQAIQARELGIGATILSSDGCLPALLVDRPELDGSFFIQHWHPDVAAANAEARAFVEAYRKAYGHDPIDISALTYDALGLLFEAIRNAGRTTPEAIRSALSQVERYPGVTGPITFRDSGGDPDKQTVIVQLKSSQLRFFKLMNQVRNDSEDPR